MTDPFTFMKLLIICTILLTFILAFWFGRLWANRNLQKKLERTRLSNTEVEAYAYLVILTELREGTTTNVINLMEYSLDCDVCKLWLHRSQMDASTLERANLTLKQIKQYRQKHPREVDNHSGSGISREEIQTTAQEASNILANY